MGVLSAQLEAGPSPASSLGCVMGMGQSGAADPRRGWRKFASSLDSAHLFAILAIFPAVWLASPDLQQLLPPRVVSAVAPFIAALGFAVRLHERAQRNLSQLNQKGQDHGN